jgi:hypothetical protein
MANWKKKEAGFIVFFDNNLNFFCEGFHNNEEKADIINKFKFLNLNTEERIGIFNNNAEIEAAIKAYTLKNGGNRQFFNKSEECDLNRIIPCPYSCLAPVTEGMFLYKWTKFKKDGGVLYTKYEAWEKGLKKDYWGYNEIMLPEGHERIKKLVLQDKITNDADKLFFWTVVEER